MSHFSLSDYSLIGNDSSAALVSRFGAIDWCCLPYLDSVSHFASLLDDNLGGRFQIVPQGEFRSEQRYIPRSLVLETYFETSEGRAILRDWMPMGGCAADPPVIQRELEAVDGRIEWWLACIPRFGYGAHRAQAEFHRQSILFRGPEPDQIALLKCLGTSPPVVQISENHSSAHSRFTLEEGSSARWIWSWGRPVSAVPFTPLRQTLEASEQRAHSCSTQGCPFTGPWHDTVSRSALLLQLLQNSGLGSIAESITTSIPGALGASRNWDLRYCWIRDSAQTIQAFFHLGLPECAQALFDWLCDILMRDGSALLQPVYQIDGGRHLPERELGHLNGYRGSRPVRVGNFSSRLFQLDVHGHFMMAASEYFRLFGSLPDGVWNRLAELADYASQAWRRPDHGPWETRSKAEHYVYSKALCWSALDRACKLAAALQEPQSPRWAEEKAILHRTICEQGFDTGARTFVRAFGDREIDASVLALPIIGFLPIEDPRIQGTLAAVQESLSEGVLLHRSQSHEGSTAPSGIYLNSSFQFVTCLALSGRSEEASDRLAELCAWIGHGRFMGEQVDPLTGLPVGNIPSASAHISMVNAALYVAAARKRNRPSLPLIGEKDETLRAFSRRLPKSA